MANLKHTNLRRLPSLASQSGQGVIEYILVLVVTVGLVLGGIYQLNMAFKVWANNYFGDYLACLLETGELPSVGGQADSNSQCNQIYKPFSISDGRPLIPQSGNQDSGSQQKQLGKTAGTSDGGHGGGGSHGGSGGGKFGSAPAGQGDGSGRNGNIVASRNNATNTGSTKASSYGGYSEGGKKGDQRNGEQLDQGFAFDNGRNSQNKNNTPVATRTVSNDSSGLRKVPLPQKPKPKGGDTGDTGLTIGNFMKYLIIAAIVIALVFFIGGQMLQMSKEME